MVTGVPENAQLTLSAEPVPTVAIDVPENAQSNPSTLVPISSTAAVTDERFHGASAFDSVCLPPWALVSLLHLMSAFTSPSVSKGFSKPNQGGGQQGEGKRGSR